MSAGVAVQRPGDVRSGRPLLVVFGAALAVACCVPPSIGPAAGTELAATLRFAALAIVVPAILVVAAPWARIRDGASAPWRSALGIDNGPGVERNGARGVTALAVDVAVMIAWRTPGLVDVVARHGAVVVVEAVTLLVAGVALWLELVEAAPHVPRATRALRAVLATLAMWSIWIVAYLEGMSHAGWYAAYDHPGGGALSATAQRQWSAAVLWAVAALAFFPVIFANLAGWLRIEGARADDEDPHAILGRRASRARD